MNGSDGEGYREGIKGFVKKTYIYSLGILTIFQQFERVLECSCQLLLMLLVGCNFVVQSSIVFLYAFISASWNHTRAKEKENERVKRGKFYCD